MSSSRYDRFQTHFHLRDKRLVRETRVRHALMRKYKIDVDKCIGLEVMK